MVTIEDRVELLEELGTDPENWGFILHQPRILGHRPEGMVHRLATDPGRLYHGLLVLGELEEVLLGRYG